MAVHRIKEGVIPSCLRIVASGAFVPPGGRYDARSLLRRPLVALRGGEDGLAAAFSVRAGRVEIAVLARGSCSQQDAERAMGLARGVAAVDDDPSELFAMVHGHPLLAELGRRHDPRLPRTPTLFESFAEAVIEQLVTVQEARASIRRLWRHAGEPIPDTLLVAAPTAEAIRRVPMWQLRAMGVGSRRAVTLHESAKRGAAIERLAQLPPEVAMDKLMSLRGVGPWTANRVARQALGWSDAVPVGDLHAPRYVTEALAGPLDRAPDDATMLAALEPFRPHRARVVKLLEMSLVRTGPLPRVDPHRRTPWAT